MNFLFIHQNFPGQFRHIASHLADAPEHRVVALGEQRRLDRNKGLHAKIGLCGYTPHGETRKETHHYLQPVEKQVRRGQSVFRSVQGLLRQGFRPDVVVAHSGWGEALFLRDVLPQARHVYYFEHAYRAKGADVGFDPEFPATVDDALRLRVLNTTQLQGLVSCDVGVTPTRWQQQGFPVEFHPKLRVMHEGIDTQRLQPDPRASLQIGDQRYRAGEEVVTYVARNLEPYRGYHVFMRALPRLLRLRPNARVIIVGGDSVSYGRRPPPGQTYQAIYRDEVQFAVDWSRVQFAGTLPPDLYLRTLQVSAAHVYLTYPFVLSWSLLEAMSVGCLVVGSDTAPVREAITHQENGLLVDFFAPDALAEQVADALARPEVYAALRSRARHHAVNQFDLQTRCLPAWCQLLLSR